MRELRARGLDVLSVKDVGLSGAEDAALFEWSRAHARIIVTRNYHDFAPIVAHANRERIAFPGVLFYAHSILQSDTGAHVRALVEWIRRAHESGKSPVENTFAWVS
jgi:predicted nuclease of predicted toxin-antitoxin system